MRQLLVAAAAAVVLAAGGITFEFAISEDSQSAEASAVTCAQSRSEALLANRIVAPSQSYRRDNPSEYTRVRSYLEGGARPTGFLTHMGLHLVALEDTCRALTTPPPTTTTTTSTTTTTTTSPPPPGEPAPIAGQGYHQAFGDEFDTFNTALWTDHAFYEDPVAGSVYVTNGVLNIDNTKAGGFTPEISVQSGPPYGGQPSRYDFTFGYAEARMRFSGGQGAWPAFWLESLGQALWDNYPNCPKKGPSGESLANANYELDIMEWLGADPQTRYASQHQNTGGTCGGPNGTRGADANVGVNLANAWHTYSVLWTSSTTKFYVDGVQYGATANTYAEANQRMYVALTMQACGWDPPNGCNASTPDVLKTEVDWVHVWQQ